MITFLPMDQFEMSLKSLDNKRLGNQRREAWAILNEFIIKGRRINYLNYRMWYGYEQALAVYGLYCCRIWIERGFNDDMIQKFEEIVEDEHDYDRPWWLGDLLFHASHRSNLLRKDPKFYSQYGWKELPFLPYVWPGGKNDVKLYTK